MKTKKIIISLIAGAVGAAVMGVSAMAEDFTIDSAQALIDYAAQVNGGADTTDDIVTVTADIDLGDAEWTPIGKVVRSGSGYTAESTPFAGSFDGGEFKIEGLKITAGAEDDGIGLFGGITDGAVIENVVLVDVEIETPACRTTGGLVGIIAGGTVSNCTVSGNVSARCAGGLVGRMLADGTVEGCTNKATVTASGSGDTGGGIVGKAYYTKTGKEMNIIDCVNEGTIIGDGAYGAGGITGFSTGNVTGCTNNGDVTATGAASAAGIVSEHGMYGEVSKNINNGDISAVGGNTAVGGIIGWLRYTSSVAPNSSYEIGEKVAVLNNINNGSVSSDSNSTTAQGVGGIVGSLYGMGTVSGNQNNADSIIGVTHAAGIVGYSINAGGTTPADIQIEGNVSSTPVENISADVVEQFAYAGHSGVTVTENAVSFVAEADGIKYTSINAAVKAVANGAVITVTDDIELDETLVIDKDITINGNGYTIKGADGDNDARVNAVTALSIKNADVTLVDITVKGGALTGENGELAANAYAGDAIVAEAAKVTVTDSEIYGGEMGFNGGLAGRAITAVDSDIVIKNTRVENGVPTKAGYGAVNVGVIVYDDDSSLEISDSTVVANYAYDHYNIGSILEGTDLGSLEPADNDITLYGDVTFVGAELNGVNIIVPEGETLTLKGSVDDSYIAKVITVKYVKKDVELDAAGNEVDSYEEADLYDIVLEGDADYINRLTTADLTFGLTSTTAVAPSYEILHVEPITITTDADYAERYMFNFDGVTQPDETAKSIVIGQVKISGYGNYTFAVANADTNLVNATKTNDSVVESFVPGGAANSRELDVDAKIEAEIVVPTRDLRIVVDFPNEVKKAAAEYQQMKIIVSGGDLKDAIIIDLGDEDVETKITTEYEKKDAKFTIDVSEDNKYTVEVVDILTVNTTYNVVIEGEGYRTDRYTVTMNCEESKTLNFWNNVKDNAIEVEEDKESSKKNVTFLAGDIVKDDTINIYDLSAVVSYFGEVNLSATNNKEYAKYDLNRDGKIDSKDVAYVLVSWGK